VCDQETSKTRRLKPATELWKIQPEWVVTAGKQTNKQANKQTSELITNIYTRGHMKLFGGNCLLMGPYQRKASDCNWLIETVSAQCAGVVVFVCC
jgi:hypothetical protein